MIKDIQHVKGGWNYLYDNSNFSKVTVFNEYMGVKSVSLTDIKLTPIFEEGITVDKIKQFFGPNIEYNWNMNIENLKKEYKKLAQLILYNDCIIILKFHKKKYLELFKIKDGIIDDDINFTFIFDKERLLAPFSLKLSLQFTTFENITENSDIELLFTHYRDDALIITKVNHHRLTLKTENFIFPEYIIILNNNNIKNK